MNVEEFFKMMYAHQNYSSSQKWLDACSLGDAEALKILLSDPACWEERDWFGVPPIHYVIMYRQTEAFEKLSKKVDLVAMDRDSRTPLMIAACSEQMEENIMRALLSRMTLEQIDQVNSAGFNALHLAAQFNRISAAQLLLQFHATVDAGTPVQETALMWAARNGHRTIVEILLQAGANPNLKNQTGDTAAMIARHNHHDELANFLEKKQHTKRTSLPRP